MKSKRYETVTLKYKDGHTEEMPYPTKCEIKGLNIEAYIAAVLVMGAIIIFGRDRVFKWAKKREDEANKRYREKKIKQWCSASPLRSQTDALNKI